MMKFPVPEYIGAGILPVLAAAGTVVVLAAMLAAQVPDPLTAAAAPVPGSGHSYIGQDGEAVNPADGTPSFALNFNLPAQRAGAFSFGIRYGGGEIFYLTPTAQDLVWMAHRPTNTRSGAALLEVGGWTYDWPEITFQEYPTNSFFDPDGFYTQCDAAGDFVFHGAGSRQVAIAGLGSQWLEGDPNYGTCTTSNPAISIEAPGGVQGATPAWSSVGVPDVSITGPGGAVYRFPGYDCCINLSAGYGNEFGELADSITDRNGNQITLNPAFNGYTDTLGRNIVSWTGLGNSGDQITISGLSGPITCSGSRSSSTCPPAGSSSAATTPSVPSPAAALR